MRKWDRKTPLFDYEPSLTRIATIHEHNHSASQTTFRGNLPPGSASPKGPIAHRVEQNPERERESHAQLGEEPHATQRSMLPRHEIQAPVTLPKRQAGTVGFGSICQLGKPSCGMGCTGACAEPRACPGVCVLSRSHDVCFGSSINTPSSSPLPVLLLRCRLSLSWPTQGIILARDDMDHLPLALEELALRHVSYVSYHFYAHDRRSLV